MTFPTIKPKRKRRDSFTPEAAAAVVEAWANGASWKDIEENKALPSVRTVRRWMRNPEYDAALNAPLSRARPQRAEHHADEAGLVLERARADALNKQIEPARARILAKLSIKEADRQIWLAGVMDSRFSNRPDLAAAVSAVACVLFGGLAGPSASLPAPAPAPRLSDGKGSE